MAAVKGALVSFQIPWIIGAQFHWDILGDGIKQTSQTLNSMTYLFVEGFPPKMLIPQDF